MTDLTTETNRKKSPLLTQELLLFLFAMVLANIGGNMYGSLMPLYLENLGAVVTQIGLFFTLSQIVPLALQILGGWLSDSIGRLQAIALGSLGGLLGYIVMILAPTWQWLLLATVFGAVSGSLVGPSFDAFIAERSSEANRARVFGVSSTLFMVVGVIGPALGGFLAEARGFRFMIMIAGLLYLIATVIRLVMARNALRQPGQKTPGASFAGLKSNLGTMFGLLVAGGLVTWILITDGVRDISYALSLNLLPIYMQDIGGLTLRQIGLINSVFGLCMMLTAYPGGWLADRVGERVGIAASFILIGVGLSILVFMPVQSVWLYTLSWAVAGTGIGLATPAYQSLISKAVPRKVRGTAYGLFSTSLGLVSLPAPWIGAQIWDRFGPRAPFLITIAVSFLSAIPAWFKFKLDKNRIVEDEEALF